MQRKKFKNTKKKCIKKEKKKCRKEMPKGSTKMKCENYQEVPWTIKTKHRKCTKHLKRKQKLRKTSTTHKSKNNKWTPSTYNLCNKNKKGTPLEQKETMPIQKKKEEEML